MIATLHECNIVVWDIANMSEGQLGSIRTRFHVAQEVNCFCAGAGRIAYYITRHATNHDVFVWNIVDNKVSAKIELQSACGLMQLNTCGSRILVSERELAKPVLVYDTDGGACLFSLDACIVLLAANCGCKDYFVGNILNGPTMVWDAATGTLVSSFQYTVPEGYRVSSGRMVCSNCNGDRPYSCVSSVIRRSMSNNRDAFLHLVVWDIIERNTYVDFEVMGMNSVQFLSFGCTDSIIITGGVRSKWDYPLFIVWELEVCSTTTKSLKAVVKFHFELTNINFQCMCFNPVMNAIYYFDRDRKGTNLDCFRIVDVATGTETATTKAPSDTGKMKFLRVEDVILM